MNVYFLTLGCKVNQYESEVMLTSLLENGFSQAASQETADVIVLNSCTVTGTSDQKVRQTLRRARRKNPSAVLVLTGCMTQAFPDLARQMPEADVILGNTSRALLLPSIQEFLSTRQPVIQVEPHRPDAPFEAMRIQGFHERTRAFIKIEDGCDRYCSYCIIPTARGRVRSKPLPELRRELSDLTAAGYREVVLVGINLSAYGKDTGHTLCDAVETACAAEGIARVRLGSLEPDLLTPETLERLAKEKTLCPQFHLSLQSGSDDTLRRMNRHYTAAEFLSLAESLRAHFPGCTLTTDVMVGFPGETDREFETSLDFVRTVGFEKVHVFAYSRRPGTRAAEMDNQIPRAEKERRSKLMIEQTNRMREKFLESLTGKTYPVLFETVTSGGLAEGYTPHYVPVCVLGGEDLCGTIRKVTLAAGGETPGLAIPAGKVFGRLSIL